MVDYSKLNQIAPSAAAALDVVALPDRLRKLQGNSIQPSLRHMFFSISNNNQKQFTFMWGRQ